MSTALLLFGLKLAPLYNAIAQVESDRGATSENMYQIRSIYVRDVNRLYPSMKYHTRDVLDKDKAEMMMWLYWKYWAYHLAKTRGVVINYELLARLHNGGPTLALTHSTDAYWARVRKELERENL